MYIYIYIHHNLKIIYIIYIYINHNLKTLKLMTFFENKTSHPTGPAFNITKEIEVYWNEISRK